MSSLNKNSEELKGIINSTILTSLFQQLDKYQNFIDETLNILKGKEEFMRNTISMDNPQEIKKILNRALESKKETLEIIDKYFPEENVADFEGGIDSTYRISDFYQNIEDWLVKFPERNVEFQKKDRFSPLETDRLYVKQIKILKKFFYSISTIPKRIQNALRKLFKKDPKQIHFWRHSIPEKSLSRWYYKFHITENLIPLFESADLKILQSLRSILANGESLDQQLLGKFLPVETPGSQKEEPEGNSNQKDDVDKGETEGLDEAGNETTKTNFRSDALSVNKVTEFIPVNLVNLDASGLKNDIKKQASSVLEEANEKLAISRDRAGTFELPAFRLNRSRLSKREEYLRHKYRIVTKKWNNAHRASLIDWKLDLELYSAIYNILILIIDLKLQMNDKIGFLDPYLKEIVEYQQEIKKKSSAKFKDRKELRKFIIESKYDTRKILKNKKVKELSEMLINQNFSGLLDKFEVTVESIIDSLPEKSWVLSNQKEGPVNESEINLISPSDLIFFESFGVLQKYIQKGKLELLKSSGSLQVSIDSICDLVDFSLDSALDMTDDETKKEQEVLDLLNESLSRSITKVEDIQEDLSEIEKTFSELVDSSASEFNSSLFSLTINENIYEIRFRFTKAKAKATTTEITEKVFVKINEGFHFVKKKADIVSDLFLLGFQRIQKLYTRNIINASITTEVSNFLAESENRRQQLPFVYQRLFKSEPVSDKGMFVGRVEELNQLENAYQKWDQAKYAATVVLSEKGSGLTSLINHFLGSLKSTYPIVRINPENRIYEENTFFKLLGGLLDSSFNSTEQVIEHLNAFTTKRIFILEDLQKFYLRKVDGFDCLSLIKRLITSTNDNIFWIVNTTLYTWEYLNKAIRIGDYFEYKIKLSDMTAEQITEIISKRNKISGYYIEFEIPENEAGNSKLKKLTEDETQEIYRNRFFTSLNRFTNSNIAISLLYWQLSVQEVTDDTIKIMYFRQPDLSFISSFDKNNLFVMQAIILHDGLTAADLAMVINNTESDCQLLLLTLFEDGILMKRNGVFILNPLIYRQTVGLLKSQNLLI